MTASRPLLFAIKRYALHDGPQIRLTIFFKGCPLSCFWCHNPEGIGSELEVVTDMERCIGCRACLDGCPESALHLAGSGVLRDRNLCTRCLNCVEICPSLAQEAIGRHYSIAEVLREIEKELPFFDLSGGGVTFSGGEPLSQAAALSELLQSCGRLELHRAIDTTGFAPTATLLDIAELTELFLFDLKHMDSDLHRRYTGVANELILHNLTQLARRAALIRIRLPLLDYGSDPLAADHCEQLQAMAIACEAAILFAHRHGDHAHRLAEVEADPVRKSELLEIARICRKIPANKPESFHEALQMYWFVHLGTITELNGWDAMPPGHLDQHLQPFYHQGLADGTLARGRAAELLACLWIKVNNHTAPPKVGVTAKESGTYNDFSQINLGGLRRDGTDGSCEVSYLALEVADALRLLQPQPSVHISRKTPERLLKAAARVIRKGYGYPSIFNADAVVSEQLRVGKSIEDAREGGTSGCIETGAFGKEAYILTGYLNVPKILEITMNNGVDPLSGRRVGPTTGDPRTFGGFEELYGAFEKQLEYLVGLKVRVNNYIERMFARYSPAPFLSVVIHDCIDQGRDYYDGGPRYNTNYIQCCGIGTVTDSLSAINTHVYDSRSIGMDRLLQALADNFAGDEPLRLRLWNRTPFFGNDDDAADTIMQRVYHSLFTAIDGRPNTKGSVYHLNMFPPPAMSISAKCSVPLPTAALPACPRPTAPRPPRAPAGTVRPPSSNR